jgi:hypothetical protein
MRQLHDSRLRGMKRPREWLQDLWDSLTRTLGGCPCTADDHHLLCRPREAPQGRVARCPRPSHHLPGEVGEQGAADTPLRAPPRWCRPSPCLPHADLPPLSQELQHPPLTNPPGDQAHQHLVGTDVHVGLDVGVHHRPAAHHGRLDPIDRLGRTALRSTALGVGLDVGLEERLEHPLARVLDPALPPRGTPPRPLSAVWLGTVSPPSRLRVVAPASQVVRTGVTEAVHALALDLLETTTIAARAPALRPDGWPGPPPHLGPDHALVERRDPSVPAPVGRSL